ncbi:protein of unknown function (DUF222) [Brevibacterium aurantiacum]|uniref:HNH nuclease domain-containing protein n=2 Tax=Brevibacterium aurantiacum TaxID=273384 RepID=A0A2H1K0U7_BREAU|nr:DUF222 domain-containing protein [Brevibacterium sp.]SMX93346.1 protein of unknown function (DUF222) [Brevibacterium aurantiacum]SMY02869.1 protein of unknown function (DUF222) [Brevibacterium aurantiacum]
MGMEAQSVPEVITEIHRWHEVLSNLPPALSEVDAIDRITALEELTSAAAAAQARETLTFDMRRRNREAEEGMTSRKQGKGVGAEIALARKVSRARGSTLLKFSRSLLIDLPHTYSALRTGSISEEKARAVAKETDWLPRDKRRQVDERMADRLAEVGVGRLGNEVRALAQQVDQQAAVAHLEKCIEERAVSVRPAPGNMAYLSALLPMPQAVAVYANLKKSAASLIGTGESGRRTQSQVMADLLVERTTGQECAEAVPTEIHLVMNDDSLVGPGDTPAWLPGVGPLPAGAARKFVAENEASVFLRRLYTRPDDGQLVRMDSRRREFSGLLRRMIVIRDDVCRSPWCDAQIKHADHATAFAAGGDTDWDNASGLCAACNFAKELNGWKHVSSPEKLIVKTPTGHRYETRTKPIDSRAGVGKFEDAAATHTDADTIDESAVKPRRRFQGIDKAHGPPQPRRKTGKVIPDRGASTVEYLFGARFRTFLSTNSAQ